MAETNQEKEKRKKARSAFLRFHKKLSTACGTFENIDEWYEYANELKDLLLEHSSVIPTDIQNNLEEATNLVDTSRIGLQKACESLSNDIQSTIESHLTEIAENIANDIASKSSSVKPEVISSSFKISSTVGAGVIGAAVIVTAVTLIALIGTDSDEMTINSDNGMNSISNEITLKLHPGWWAKSENHPPTPLNYESSSVIYGTYDLDPNNLFVKFTFHGAQPNHQHTVAMATFYDSISHCPAGKLGQYDIRPCHEYTYQGVTRINDSIVFGNLKTDENGFGVLEAEIIDMAPGTYEVVFGANETDCTNCDVVYATTTSFGVGTHFITIPETNLHNFLVSSGMEDHNTPLSLGSRDPHFVVVENDYQQAFVINPPSSTWIQNDENSQWIWENANGEPVNVIRTFRTSFDLTGFDYSTTKINMHVGADNSLLDVHLNGNSVDISLDDPAFTTLQSFSITEGFQSGINSLDFVVQDIGEISGFRVDLSGFARPMP